MNVLRDYNPRVYKILDIEQRLISKAEFSKVLGSWINRNNYYNTGIIYINDDIISELSGLPINTQYNPIRDGWWKFITLVYKKWVRKP